MIRFLTSIVIQPHNVTLTFRSGGRTPGLPAGEPPGLVERGGDQKEKVCKDKQDNRHPEPHHPAGDSAARPGGLTWLLFI